MESTVKERLVAFLKEINISQKKFEISIDVSNGYVNNIRQSIQPDKIQRISLTYPYLNTGWLLTGQGEMLNSEKVATPPSPPTSKLGVPIIPFEAIAGYNGHDNEGIGIEQCERYIVPEFDTMGVEFIVRVSGSSMYPKYSNGDLLACRKIREIVFFQWGKVYVIDGSQGVMVKRIFEDSMREDYIMCVSDNKEHYPAFSIPKTDIRSLSIVLGVIRTE